MVCDKVVCQRWVDKVVCERWRAGSGRLTKRGGGRRRGGGGAATRDTESKKRTPHKVVGNKRKLIISGDLFFWLKCSSLGASDIQGCYSPKGITYMIYTLIHGRDPIPCRTTYIEYRSPVKIFINFLRNTTQFHWFSLQNSFFHSSTTPVVGGTLR